MAREPAPPPPPPLQPTASPAPHPPFVTHGEFDVGAEELGYDSDEADAMDTESTADTVIVVSSDSDDEM